MKLTVLLLLAASLHIGAYAHSQVTISETNVSLTKVFRQIEQQTGYTFWYNNSLLEKANAVTIKVKNVTLEAALAVCFKEQPLTYSIVEKVIVLKALPPRDKEMMLYADVSGKVMNEKGEPVAGATVMDKQTKKATATDAEGTFQLSGIDEHATLIITSIGYEPLEWTVSDDKPLQITLKVAVNTLDETVVIAYGTTTKRLNTGSVTKVTSEEIQRQPVSNPLATLMGRVPGLEITPTGGLPGSAFKIRIRGQSSIGASPNVTFQVSNDPLIIIDGTPFSSNNTSINLLSNATSTPGNASNGGFSPLNLINPQDIESIEVLKDADATAIYGSRGANGVILITTRKSTSNGTTVSLNLYNSFSKVNSWPRLLNTKQYVEVRKEALRNDGLTPTFSNAPDLVAYDSTSYTNIQKAIAGEDGITNDIQLSISGGNNQTNFLVGGGYNRQTTVFINSTPAVRGSMHFNFRHTSSDRRLSVTLNGNYGNSVARLPSNDITQFTVYVPPTTPRFLTSTGQLNWIYNGAEIVNPLGQTFYRYKAQSSNLITDLSVAYQLTKGLSIKTNLGYNVLTNDETNQRPRSAQNPLYNPRSSATFANGSTGSWIVEPQLTYSSKLAKGRISSLLGYTLQKNESENILLSGSNYSSEALLGSIAGSTTITASNNKSQYKYVAVFARINYNWQEKYLLNLTGRRDGSSRFGPDRQFANFGAIGAGWVFSNESFMKAWKFLSFGKLRASYGITGNDGIGNYNYLDSWTSTTGIYQVAGVRPSRLFNPDFGWETNRKYETALELGLNKDKIFISAAYFLNRTSNQLTNFSLPTQTGFSAIVKNLPALIQNSGVEISVTSKNIDRKDFKWSTSVNLTIPRNKLVEFDNIDRTGFASTMVIGQPVTVIRGYKSLGVDPQTGIYQFEDVNKDGQISNLDFINIGTGIPKYYGGLSNTFSWKSFELSGLLEFKNQQGPGFLNQVVATPPGYPYNMSVEILDRWQKPGDIARIQKYTTNNSTILTAAQRFAASDGVMENLSFIRMKNVALSYHMPALTWKKVKLNDLKLFVLAQNAFTIKWYDGMDPETRNIFSLPPLKTLAFGCNLNF